MDVFGLEAYLATFLPVSLWVIALALLIIECPKFSDDMKSSLKLI